MGTANHFFVWLRRERTTERLFSELTILNGPFKGVRYPHIESVGSMICPKLLDSYEKEVVPFIDQILAQSYTGIVDIGCAEGYDAVGLAMHQKQAKVFAFDTDQRASAQSGVEGAANKSFQPLRCALNTPHRQECLRYGGVAGNTDIPVCAWSFVLINSRAG